MSFYLTRSGRFQNMFYDFLRPTSPGGAPLRCAVAIPAKNEVDRLPACLNALALQRRRSGEALAPGVFEVVLFANNCDDGTADRAREFALHLPFQIHVTDERLAPAVSHAGEARRRAMDLALACLERRGAGRAVILTTDADSLVPATWIDENLSAIDEGADAVLGRVALDEDGVGLPVELHRRGALEDEYENLLTETASILDPVDWNPWPHHATISGASVAVTAEAYRLVGGIPRVKLGEDKALVGVLALHDAKVRYSNAIEVVTSARLAGRAAGGVADTLRLRSLCPEAGCDEALEPYAIAEKRAFWRGRMRELRSRRGTLGLKSLTEDMRLPSVIAREVLEAQTFGRAWTTAELASPRLLRQQLRPADLPREIAAGKSRLAALKIKAARALSTVESGRNGEQRLAMCSRTTENDEFPARHLGPEVELRRPGQLWSRRPRPSKISAFDL